MKAFENKLLYNYLNIRIMNIKQDVSQKNANIVSLKFYSNNKVKKIFAVSKKTIFTFFNIISMIEGSWLNYLWLLGHQ